VVQVSVDGGVWVLVDDGVSTDPAFTVTGLANEVPHKWFFGSERGVR
jgi:hypothetical protein